MRKVMFFLLLSSIPLFGQISLRNFSEYQWGNLPNSEPADLSTWYNQLNLEYRRDAVTVGLRHEVFQSAQEGRSYEHLAQRFVEWRQGPFTVRLGNFYATLGRGLTLRAFELPNVIFEQRERRKRYAYYRDIDGLLAHGKWNKIEVTALVGRPLNDAVPPDRNQNRRQGWLQGGQLVHRPWNWLAVGGAYLRTELPNILIAKNEINSLFGEINASSGIRRLGLNGSTLKFYGEHAASNVTDGNPFTARQPYADYLNANFTYKRFGLSSEYKEYRQFETHINQPPLGYMEHSYYLLNRSTHQLLADNETGYQVELTWRLNRSVFLLVNGSEAANHFFNQEYRFRERMAEVTFHPVEQMVGKFFYNVASDELKSEKTRQTGGLNMDWTFINSYSLSFDLQHQVVEQGVGEIHFGRFNNSYLALTLASSPDWSASLVMERSNDPAETDVPDTAIEEKAAISWLSVLAAWQISMAHEVQVFAGKRRGGLACTSGTCYEVLPFKGVELRWIAHF